MLSAFAILLGLQLVGEIVVRALSLPIPGPVLGMLLLFIGFIWRGNIPDYLQQTSQSLLQHLSLFFVPAGVGVMVHIGLLQQEWLAIVITLLGSTWLALLVTAWVLQALLKRWEAKE